MLILKDINVVFNSSNKLERSVLNNLSLHVKTGEFVVVIGGNGAGKSTMLDVISGFLEPNSGRVIIDGKDVTNMPQIHRSALVAKVMQDPKIGTMGNMTIFENMAFAFKRGEKRGVMPFNRKHNRQLFRDKLQILDMNLEYLLDEMVCNLSGGQRQALSVIMSVLSDSKILLLDEITAALDPDSSDVVMQLIARIIKHEKLSCIMITHNMDHAASYGDRLLLLKNGSVIEFDNR
jgi:putative ABC transport system ATP-binding protein